jgi:hypothetical protein
MATCLFHQNGRMEYWNIGILGIKAEINHFNCKKLLQTHYSIIPLFQHSNCERSELSSPQAFDKFTHSANAFLINQPNSL